MPYFERNVELPFQEVEDRLRVLNLDLCKASFVVVLAFWIFSEANLIILKRDLDLILVVLKQCLIILSTDCFRKHLIQMK